MSHDMSQDMVSLGRGAAWRVDMDGHLGKGLSNPLVSLCPHTGLHALGLSELAVGCKLVIARKQTDETD